MQTIKRAEIWRSVGRTPFDMLRYDCCFIKRSDLTPNKHGELGEVGILFLSSNKAERPRMTDARWSSFGCYLSFVNTIDLNNSEINLDEWISLYPYEDYGFGKDYKKLERLIWDYGAGPKETDYWLLPLSAVWKMKSE